MKSALIRQFRRHRINTQLSHPCARQYAFVGMGGHSLANLYPVLGLLHVPLKYICVTSLRKAELIRLNAAAFPGQAMPTTSLDTVLSDPEVAGVFVSALPAAHYGLASAVMQKGKALFVEKPPCRTLNQLEDLIGLQNRSGTLAFVGMQKRFAPAVICLKKCLKREKVHNYSLRYCVGQYPEGDFVTELFIHPIDLVLFLFGQAEILSCKCVAGHTYVLMLMHGDVVGTMELSTGYSWTAPVENLVVHTHSGEYTLHSIDTLMYRHGGKNVAGIPLEKIVRQGATVEKLCCHDSFSPTLESSNWVEHGFYNELKAFVDAVERSGIVHGSISSPSLQSMLPTYRILKYLKNA